MALAAPAASAQGLIESLIDALNGPPPPPRQLPPIASAYAEPMTLTAPAFPLLSKTIPDAGGAWSAYCVRLCDGRFFPLQRSFSVSPAEQCRSMCPTAKTKVLGGSSINTSAAADGTRYTSLPTAFLYRTRVIDNCTCNGRDAFGVTQMDIANDPTLRAGDIVAVNGGFVAYTGAKSRTASDFTPVEKYSGISNETRRKLAQTKVMPARQTAQQASNARAAITVEEKSEMSPMRRAERRAQLFR